MEYIREDGKKLNTHNPISCHCGFVGIIKDLHYWSEDDRPQLLCPGCDETLITLHSPDDDIKCTDENEI